MFVGRAILQILCERTDFVESRASRRSFTELRERRFNCENAKKESRQHYSGRSTHSPFSVYGESLVAPVKIVINGSSSNGLEAPNQQKYSAVAHVVDIAFEKSSNRAGKGLLRLRIHRSLGRAGISHIIDIEKIKEFQIKQTFFVFYHSAHFQSLHFLTHYNSQNLKRSSPEPS